VALRLYPAIEPDDRGMLEVGDAHRIYWETCGNPAGKPAVAFHGGPGSGGAPWWRRLFDPRAYRIVCFDQRGCGRSTPYAGAPTADLAVNTTDHLIADIEALRRHLEIDRWLVLGGSWGSTLALAYAEAHPEQVSELVLFSVVTTTRSEVLWITRDVGRLYPREWEQFRAGAPEAGADDLVAAYAARLADPDPSVRDRAARSWCAWEDTHVRGHADQPPDPRYDDPAFRLCFARLVTHYWQHTAWRRDGELLDGVERLASVPAVLVHGRQDLSSPLDVPWQLRRRWPGSDLVVVDHAGHSAGALSDAIVAATDRFATRR
jgi:proline iminopeptidase